MHVDVSPMQSFIGGQNFNLIIFLLLLKLIQQDLKPSLCNLTVFSDEAMTNVSRFNVFSSKKGRIRIDDAAAEEVVRRLRDIDDESQITEDFSEEFSDDSVIFLDFNVDERPDVPEVLEVDFREIPMKWEVSSTLGSWRSRGWKGREMLI